MTEFLMLGLRTAEGVSHARFSELFGHDLEASLGGRIDSLERRGYLARLPGPDSGGPRLAATDTGMDLLDRVLAELLADLPDSHRRSHAAPQT